MSTEKSGIEVDKELHDDLTQIMMERTSEVQKKCGSECFQSIFWEQQLQVLKAKNSIHAGGILYDDQMDTSTCSSAAYNDLGVIILPFQRMLRDYTRWIESGVGIQPAVTAQLIQEAARSTNQEDLRPYAAVVFDEMKIK